MKTAENISEKIMKSPKVTRFSIATGLITIAALSVVGVTTLVYFFGGYYNEGGRQSESDNISSSSGTFDISNNDFDISKNDETNSCP